MAKSLKEALLEKFSDLQELGIAPTSAPPAEDDGPAVVVDMRPENQGDGGRRQRSGRVNSYDDDRRGGDVPIRPRSRPRREERGDRGRFGDQRPRRDRPSGDREMVPDVPLTGPRPIESRPPMAGRPPFGDRPPVTGRPPFGDRPGGRPPIGNRPPGGPGGFRPGGPGGPPRQFDGPGRPMGTSDRLRERADQRRRDEELHAELQQVLGGQLGGEPDSAAIDGFMNGLAQEVGALPPLERVIEAIKLANSAEPAKVGGAVRQLYRRPRARPAPTPS